MSMNNEASGRDKYECNFVHVQVLLSQKQLPILLLKIYNCIFYFVLIIEFAFYINTLHGTCCKNFLNLVFVSPARRHLRWFRHQPLESKQSV